MSWGALPFWVYQVQYEQFLAKALGAMQEELEAGFVRSLPEHVVKMQIERRDEDESSLQRQRANMAVSPIVALELYS